jgi:hypothetical protein
MDSWENMDAGKGKSADDGVIKFGFTNSCGSDVLKVFEDYGLNLYLPCTSFFVLHLQIKSLVNNVVSEFTIFTDIDMVLEICSNFSVNTL